MNLNGIVSVCVAAVNPMVTATYSKSTGYTTAGDGSRVPTYAAPIAMSAQIQSLQYNDLQQISGLNINGEKRAIYLNGNWEGVSRPDGKGGDMITLPDGSVWLVVQVLENWAFQDGWVKVAVVRQVP
jgi:hypothetical protein